MRASEVREKYLKFFEKRGHKIISPASLVLKDDSTTLFTSAGMQPLVPYLMGKKHEDGKRLVDSQPCFRSQDIEEVGDNRHTTFFEMLGNWSLGDYFKDEQIPWFWEFLTKELGLPKEKLYITVFEGSDGVPEDTESQKLWKGLGVADDHIFKYGLKKNWWSRAGTPDEMPDGEIGGPTSEVFFEFDTIKHNKKFGEKCHPNCDCGRFLEIGNSVFMVYEKKNGKLIELPNKNVDFGGGLERLTAATNNDPDVFKIDLFWPLIEILEKRLKIKYGDSKEVDSQFRVIVDHIKASTFLIASGVFPSNKLHGYVLRRLVRRAVVKLMHLGNSSENIARDLSAKVFDLYPSYLGVPNSIEVTTILGAEIDKFMTGLTKGAKLLAKYVDSELDAKATFDFYQNYGFPYEVLKEEAEKLRIKIATKEDFDKKFNEHQELSRKSSEKKFGLK